MVNDMDQHDMVNDMDTGNLRCDKVYSVLNLQRGVPTSDECPSIPESTDAISMTDPTTSIHFDAALHTYMLKRGDCIRIPIVSTTGACADAEPKFDQEKALNCVMRNPRKPQYEGMSRQAIIDKWELNKTQAADLGTEAHFQIEMMLLGKPHRDCPEVGHALRALQIVSDVCISQFGCTDVTVMAVEGILTGRNNEIAGSPDLVLRLIPGEELVIVDWKRSKAALQNAASANMSTPVADCHYSKYHAQINVYAELLEEAGFSVVAGFLCNVHPDDQCVDARVVRVPRRPIMARRILCALSRRLDALRNSESVPKCSMSGQPVRKAYTTKAGHVDVRIAHALKMEIDGWMEIECVNWSEIMAQPYDTCNCCTSSETSYIQDKTRCTESVMAAEVLRGSDTS